MQTATIRNQRVLALLVSQWEAEHGSFGFDRHIRLQRLCNVLPDDCDLPLLQRLLCPVFAMDAKQQEQFNTLFGSLAPDLRWLEKLSDLIEPKPSVESISELQTPAKPKSETPLVASQEPPPEIIAPPLPELPESPLAPVVTEITHDLVDIPEPQPSKTRRPLIVELDECTDPPFSWNIVPDGSTDVAVETDEVWSRTLWRMRRREPTRFPVFDVAASVQATIRQGGMPVFRYRQYTRPPEYLLLVERFSQNDHRAGLFDYLFRSLRENLVLAERFYYTGDLRICRNEKYPAGLKLHELHYRFPTARLLVVGWGYRFIHSRTGLLADWTNLLGAWQSRILLTPVPYDDWGHREQLLQKIFTLLPASVHSLRYISDAPEDGITQYDTLPDYIRRIAEFEPIVLEQPMMRALHRHFDTDMLCWIAACAVYPALHFTLTLRFGRLLSAFAGYNLVTADNLISLSRLPWFTEGKIPVEHRNELLDYMEHRHPEWHKMVLNDLRKLMEDNLPPPNSAAWAEHQINLAFLKTKMDLVPDAETIHQLRAVVKRLDRPQRREDFILPEKWEELLGRIGEEQNEAEPDESSGNLGQDDIEEIQPDATISPLEPDFDSDQIHIEGNVVAKFPPAQHKRSESAEKKLKPYLPRIAEINYHFEQYQRFSDDKLRSKTHEFRERIREYLHDIDAEIEVLREQTLTTADFNDKDRLFNEVDKLRKERDKALEEILLSILPEAFAVVKEVCRRFTQNEDLIVAATDHDRYLVVKPGKSYIALQGDKAVWKNKWTTSAGTDIIWDMVHYDVQLLSGMVLHDGKIAEIALGEGQNLIMTLPAYLNGLAGEGVHVATVNSHLARRDSEWVGPIYEFLLLTVDCIDKYRPQSPERIEAYRCDIIYGTNSEFGFDYLRDNMAVLPEEIVQRRHHYAIVDEVDSVLIDNAHFPLTISGPVTRGSEEQEYVELNPAVKRLVDEQNKLATQFLSEVKKRMSDGFNDSQASLALLRAYRASPKSRALVKFLSEEGVKSLLKKTEKVYSQGDSKQMPVVDNELVFTVDEQNRSVILTDKGEEYLAKFINDPYFFILPDLAEELVKIDRDNTLNHEKKIEAKVRLSQDYGSKNRRIHVVQQLLNAYILFDKDNDYLVVDGEVKALDEQTSRVIEWKRYPDGLHQAIEAKESLKVSEVTQTYATMTPQNFFKMYHKLAGATNTAETEAKELWDNYKLDVVVIPTNRPVVRKDEEDLVYKTAREKFNAVVDDIIKLRDIGRPVLVGTTSVEISELLSRMLKMRGIDHNVLNAKQRHEAEIVAEAGSAGKVTIAANVTGRGIVIELGPGVIEAGGLAVIGTERHKNRRLDHKLRSLAGPNGDPGSSQFYLSFEDTLLQNIAQGQPSANWMVRIGLIQRSKPSDDIEQAQKKAESNQFSHRKRQTEYDQVIHAQCEAIYRKRRNVLSGERLAMEIHNAFSAVTSELVQTHRKGRDFETFRHESIRLIGINPEIDPAWFKSAPIGIVISTYQQQVFDSYNNESKEAGDSLMPLIKDVYAREGHRYKRILVPITDGTRSLNIGVDIENAIKTNGESIMRDVEKTAALALIDDAWKEHLRKMDDLRASVQTASLINEDPIVTFKMEAHNLFEGLLETINTNIASFFLKGALDLPDEQRMRQAQEAKTTAEAQRRAQSNRLLTSSPVQHVKPIVRDKVVGRNDPCPCGSGKKYKHCHGR